jgi:hypothetical protein
LQEQVRILTRRNAIAALGASAMTEGDRTSYEVLDTIRLDPAEKPDIRQAAFSEYFQVKRFWLGINRIKGVEFSWKGADGNPKQESQLTTCDLIYECQRAQGRSALDCVRHPGRALH